MVVSALCYGLLAISEVNMREPAPFLVLIGPERAVTVGEIDKGFVDFYAELFKEGDMDQALAKLSGKFALFLADRLFVRAFIKYLKEECKGQGRQDRIERCGGNLIMSDLFEENG